MGQTRKQKYQRMMENHECVCHGSGKEAYGQHRAYHMERSRVRRLEIERKKALVAMLSADDLHRILNEWITGGFHRQVEYMDDRSNYIIQDRDMHVVLNLQADAVVYGTELPDWVSGNQHFQACLREGDES